MARTQQRVMLPAGMAALIAGAGLRSIIPSSFSLMGLKLTTARLQQPLMTKDATSYCSVFTQQQAERFAAMPSAVVCLLAGVAVAASTQRRRRCQVAGVARACAPLEYGEDLDVPDDSFVVLGLANCFEQGEGKLKDVWVLEPVSASTVEVVDNGAQTSYEAFFGTTVGQLLEQDASAFPAELMCGHEVQWGDNLKFRTGCAARTWMRDHARDVVRALVPLGATVKTLSRGGEFNTSTEHKRILNFVNVVKDSDNIKQDMSIDVYGRENEDEEELASQIEELSNV